MDSLTCPKCQGAMRSYERSGVTIDQCTDCRGIFLDRGELERLIDADTRFHAEAAAPAAPVAPAPPPPPQHPPRQQHRGYESHYDDSPDKRYDDRYYGSKRKKKRSIFEDLFD